MWQVQHFVWSGGVTFSWQAQYFRQTDFRQMEWRNCKAHWYEAVSPALNFHFRRKSRRIASFLTLSKLRALRRSRRIASCSSLQITLHCITLCYPTAHHTTLRYATLRYATHTHNTTQHNTTQHNTTLHYTTLHYTILHTLHYTTLQLQLQIQIYYALLRYITLHYLHTNYTIYTNSSTRR